MERFPKLESLRTRLFLALIAAVSSTQLALADSNAPPGSQILPGVYQGTPGDCPTKRMAKYGSPMAIDSRQLFLVPAATTDQSKLPGTTNTSVERPESLWNIGALAAAAGNSNKLRCKVTHSFKIRFSQINYKDIQSASRRLVSCRHKDMDNNIRHKAINNSNNHKMHHSNLTRTRSMDRLNNRLLRLPHHQDGQLIIRPLTIRATVPTTWHRKCQWILLSLKNRAWALC